VASDSASRWDWRFTNSSVVDPLGIVVVDGVTVVVGEVLTIVVAQLVSATKHARMETLRRITPGS
jgi:hypothetical protein